MSKPEQKDWLEQTWEIKRKMAERYKGVPFSEQLDDMHKRVVELFRKKGWKYPGEPDAQPDAGRTDKAGGTAK